MGHASLSLPGAAVRCFCEALRGSAWVRVARERRWEGEVGFGSPVIARRP